MSVVPRVKRCESEIHGELTSVRRRRREVGRSLENENHILMRMHSKCIYTGTCTHIWLSHCRHVIFTSRHTMSRLIHRDPKTTAIAHASHRVMAPLSVLQRLKIGLHT
jgi:hypothetical protein